MDNTDDFAEPTPHRPRRAPWALIALVVVLTLVAIWLVPEDERAPPALPPLPQQQAAEPAAPAPAEPEATTAEGTEPADETPAAEGDIARAYITSQRASGAPDLPAAYTEAERLRAAGQLTDAWLIHFYAARLGHAPSALVLGTLSDPTYFDAGLGILDAPDPAQAVKWYKSAADAGDAEAARRLQNLRNRIERDAAAGDVDAQRLVLQWR